MTRIWEKANRVTPPTVTEDLAGERRDDREPACKERGSGTLGRGHAAPQPEAEGSRLAAGGRQATVPVWQLVIERLVAPEW